MRKKIKGTKELWICDQCKEIEQNIRVNNSEKAFDMVKTLMQKWLPKMKAIEDNDGKLLTNILDILARWKEYFEELCNHMLANNESQHHCDKEPPILKDEVIAAIET